MGLIIKNKIPMMKKGYPTVSDKYDVAGGTLKGSTNVKFGDLVKYSATAGYYEAISSAVTLANIAGFVLATNVKLAEGYPGTEPEVKAGEAFNLLVKGFMAIDLDPGATASYITPNASLYVILATGKITTSDNAAEGTIVELPGVVFTGTYEQVGSVYRAEIYVK